LRERQGEGECVCVWELSVDRKSQLRRERKRERKKDTHRAFHGFGQAKFPDGGSILGSIQFLILPPKILLDSKVVKIEQKIIISLH